MIQIEPHLLWLGNVADCRNPVAIHAAEIQAAVQLAWEEKDALSSREMIILRIPIHDGSGNDPAVLRLAIDVIARLISSKIRTLVCCGAGISRSPAVAACALAQTKGCSPATTLELVRSYVRTDVSPALWHDLLTATKSP